MIALLENPFYRAQNLRQRLRVELRSSTSTAGKAGQADLPSRRGIIWIH
jgi:hypothetical protein